MMQPWFPKAKLGIFMHWGAYSVYGIPESWSFFNGEISYADYMKQLDGFTASRYNPAEWADLFKRAGANYAVLTAKHHDGVALWPTKESKLNVVDSTPAGRDLIGMYCDAMREANLQVGIYFSHLDWSHPDYAPIPAEERNSNTLPARFADWTDGPDNPAWQRFLKFHRAQLKELCERYSPDLLWFDGDWTPHEGFWNMPQLREQLHEWRPGVILNARMHGQGDYETPEQGVPITAPHGVWEFNMTMNDSWGYNPKDKNYKSTRQIVRMFSECIGMGGNMLLDIGPKEDGTIPAEQVQRLEELGAWIGKNAEAIYPTSAGLPTGLFYGATTLSSDRKTIYAFIFDRPWDSIAIKGLQNKINKITVLATGEELSHRKIGGAPWMNVPGVTWIDIPESVLDPLATVVKIDLEGELDLYLGHGQSITAN